MQIFCGYCGHFVEYNKAWKGLSKVMVCGERCLNEIEKLYAQMIIGKKNKEGLNPSGPRYL